LKSFQELKENISAQSEEANDNVRFLRQIQSSCQALSNSDPSDIPEILPELLMKVRMIWDLSK